jgi:hypothetical protein
MKHGHLHNFADWIPTLLPGLYGLIGDLKLMGHLALREAQDFPGLLEFIWSHVGEGKHFVFREGFSSAPEGA